MEIRFISLHKLVMEIPALVSAGDCFNLEGPRFAPGSIGQVVAVLGQSAGRTRVEVSVIRGCVISRDQKSRVAEQAEREEEELRELERERAERTKGVERSVEDSSGGESWVDYDPRPRSGEQSLVVNSDSGILGVNDWATEGMKVLIKKKDGTAPEPFEAPPLPRRGRALSSGDRDFSTARSTAPGLSEIVSRVTGTSLPIHGSVGALTQEDYASSMGLKIEKEEMPVSGGRKSRVASFKDLVAQQK